MSEFDNIFERIEIKELAPYFLYGGESIIKSTENYEQIVKKSFKKALEDLKGLCENTNEDEEKLINILFEYGGAYSNVYLQIGVLIGFQLFKVMEQDYCKSKEIGTENILKQYIDLFLKSEMEKKKSGEE